MKKLFSLLLVFAMILSLCACSGKINKSNVLGTWETEFIADYKTSSVHIGDKMIETYNMYEGDVCDYILYNETTNKKLMQLSGTYEIKDNNILTITIQSSVSGSIITSLKFDSGKDVLVSVKDSKKTFYKK